MSKSSSIKNYSDNDYSDRRDSSGGYDDQEDEGRGYVAPTVVPVQTTASTFVAVGGAAAVTGTAAADYYAATGSVAFQGGGGGDQIKLLKRGGTDAVIFASPDDGAAAGAGYGCDQIKNFQTGVDKLVIGGALRSLLDHNGDGALTIAGRSRNGVSGGDEVVFLTDDVGDFDKGNLGKIAGRIGATQGSGDVLAIVTHEDETAVLLVRAAGGATATAGDIRMLGVFKDARLTIGDVAVG